MISSKQHSKPSADEIPVKSNQPNDRFSSNNSSKNSQNYNSKEIASMVNDPSYNTFNVPIESVNVDNEKNRKFSSETKTYMKKSTADQSKKRPPSSKVRRISDSKNSSHKGTHNCQSNHKNSMPSNTSEAENITFMKDFENGSRMSFNSKDNKKQKYIERQKVIKKYHKELKNFYKKDTLKTRKRSCDNDSRDSKENFLDLPTDEIEKLDEMQSKLRKFAVTVLDADKPYTYSEVSQKLLEINNVIPLKGSATHSLSNKISRELKKNPKDKEIIDYALIEQFNNALNEIVGIEEGFSMSSVSSREKLDFQPNLDSNENSRLFKSRTFSCNQDMGKDSYCFSPMQKLVDRIVEENEELEDVIGTNKWSKANKIEQKITGKKMRPQSVKVDRRRKMTVTSEKKIESMKPDDFNVVTLPDDLKDNYYVNQFYIEDDHDKLNNGPTSQFQAYSYVIQEVIKNAHENLEKMRNAKSTESQEDFFDNLLMHNTFGEKSRLTVQTIKLMKEKFNSVLRNYCKIEHLRESKIKRPVQTADARKGRTTIGKIQNTVNYKQKQTECQKELGNKPEEQSKEFIMDSAINLNAVETVSENLEEIKSCESLEKEIVLDESQKYDAFNNYGGNQIQFKTNENARKPIESRRETENMILKEKMNVYLENCRKDKEDLEFNDRNSDTNNPFKTMSFNRESKPHQGSNEYLENKALQDYQKEYRMMSEHQKSKIKYLYNKMGLIENNQTEIDNQMHGDFVIKLASMDNSPRMTHSGLWKIESDKPVLTKDETAILKQKHDPFGRFDNYNVGHPDLQIRKVKNSPTRSPDVKIRGPETGVKKMQDRQKIRQKQSPIMKKAQNILKIQHPLLYKSYRDSTDNCIRTEFEQAITSDSLYVKYMPTNQHTRINSVQKDRKAFIKNAVHGASTSSLDNNDILISSYLPKTRNVYLEKLNTMQNNSDLDFEQSLIRAPSKTSNASNEFTRWEKTNMDPQLPYSNNLNDASERKINIKQNLKIDIKALKKKPNNSKNSVTNDKIGDYIQKASIPKHKLNQQISSGIRDQKNSQTLLEKKGSVDSGLRKSRPVTKYQNSSVIQKKGSVDSEVRKVKPITKYQDCSLQFIGDTSKTYKSPRIPVFNKFNSFCENKTQQKSEALIQICDTEKSYLDIGIENNISTNLLEQSEQKVQIETSQNYKESHRKTLASTAANTNLENSHFIFTEQKENPNRTMYTNSANNNFTEQKEHPNRTRYINSANNNFTEQKENPNRTMHTNSANNKHNANTDSSHFIFTEQKENPKRTKYTFSQNKNYKQDFEKSKQKMIDSIIKKNADTLYNSPSRSPDKSIDRIDNAYFKQCAKRAGGYGRSKSKTVEKSHGYSSLEKRKTLRPTKILNSVENIRKDTRNKRNWRLNKAHVKYFDDEYFISSRPEKKKPWTRGVVVLEKHYIP